MRQRQKNIRLTGILIVLVIVTSLVWIFGGKRNTLDVPRDLFSYTETESIDEAIIGEDTLSFDGNYWMVNGDFKADPQRVEVFFAIAKQVQVRRQASQSQMDSLNERMSREGVNVRLFQEGELVKQYQVWNNPSRGMTWMRIEDTPYLVEIPGYRSYLGGIFELDENSWRYPIIYDINWQNLQGVSVNYPEKEEASFDISYSKGFYGINSLPQTDSLKVTDFLDNLSLLYVNDYLFQREMESYDSLLDTQQANIIVRDVGQNAYVLDIYEKVPGRDEILIRIDSSQYGLADYQRVKTLLKPRSFFRQQ
jgi:hypothetical protein